MTKQIEDLYEWLAAQPDAKIDAIFAAALAHAESPFLEAIAEVLLKRGNADGYAALLANCERLPKRLHKSLDAGVPAFRDGAARAMKTGGANVRLSILTLLLQRPSAKLTYIVVDALRDSSQRVRELAPLLLRRIAETVADRPPPDKGDPDAEDCAADQQLLVRGLMEGLRSYDLHLRPEVVESSLWFARDMGAALWSALETRTSKISRAVEIQLEVWDHPRLNGFLLQALLHPEWRGMAQKLLRQRTRVHSLSVILRNSDFLDMPAGAKAAAALRCGNWFEELPADCASLPGELRAELPRWVVALELPTRTAIDLLTGWWEHADERMRRAIAYGLARLDCPEAMDTLRRLAADEPRIAAFAQWYFAIDGNFAGIAAQPPAAPAAMPATDDDSAPEEAPGEFVQAWTECRRETIAGGSAWVRLRENALQWSEPIRRKASEGDARDRLLCLRLFAETQLKRNFERELRELANDQVPGIRRVAETLLTPSWVGCAMPLASTWQIPVDLSHAIRKAINSPLGGGGETLLIYLLGCAALIGVGLAVNRLFFNRKARAAARSVDYLRLAIRRLDLSRAERRMIVRLARRAKVSEPLALLLTPMNLAFAAQHAGGAAHGRLASICRRLHDCDLPQWEKNSVKSV